MLHKQGEKIELLAAPGADALRGDAFWEFKRIYTPTRNAYFQAVHGARDQARNILIRTDDSFSSLELSGGLKEALRKDKKGKIDVIELIKASEGNDSFVQEQIILSRNDIEENTVEELANLISTQSTKNLKSE